MSALPGPCPKCREAGHDDFPYPPCQCATRGCWCPISAADPLDLPLPPHVLDRQTAIDLDEIEGRTA